MIYAKFTLVVLIWFAAGYCWGQATANPALAQVRVIEKLIVKTVPTPTRDWTTPDSALQVASLITKPPKNLSNLIKNIKTPRPHFKGDAL